MTTTTKKRAPKAPTRIQIVAAEAGVACADVVQSPVGTPETFTANGRMYVVRMPRDSARGVEVRLGNRAWTHIQSRLNPKVTVYVRVATVGD